MDASQSTNYGAKRKFSPSAYCPNKDSSASFTCPKEGERVKETQIFNKKVGTSEKYTQQSYEYPAATVATYRGCENPYYFLVPSSPEELNQSSGGWKTAYHNIKNYICNWKTSDLNSGIVPESTQCYFGESETNDRKFDNSVHKRTKPTPFSLSEDPEINTLEDSMYYFEFQSHFSKLESNLEEVRRNKKSKKEHVECFKSVDKAIQKKSSIYHPDCVRNNGGSDLQLEIAQKLQAALNTTRKILKVLTEEFLKDTDIDYKYEYFLKLEISLLANETELSHRINEILFKICQLSEIKRMNIVGEIRNFLLESKACIDSYFEWNRKEFKKKCSFALFHLKKCIEGYEKFETECKILEKECEEEDEGNMKSTIVKLAEQSMRESMFLRQLESFAKSFLDRKFQFLPPFESMDSYFILPFVYYINVMLMCSIMLEKEHKHSWFSTHSGAVIFIEEPSVMAYAYYLVTYFMGQKQYKEKVACIIGKKYYDISEENIKETFNNALKEIVKLLEERFKTDTYKKGKSNRMRFNERLSDVNKTMANFHEKEKKLREQIRIYEKNNEENWKKYHQFEQKNEEMERRARENLENIKSDISKLLINGTEDVKVSGNDLKSENQEIWRKDDNVAKEDSIENDRKFQKYLEQNESMRKTVSEVILLNNQNKTDNRNTFEQNKKGNWRKNDLVKCSNAENECKPCKKCEKTENLSELLLQRNQSKIVNKNSVVDEGKDEQSLIGKNAETECEPPNNFEQTENLLELLLQRHQSKIVNKNSVGDERKHDQSLKGNISETECEPPNNFEHTENNSKLLLQKNQCETINKNQVEEEGNDDQIRKKKIIELEELLKKNLEDCKKTVEKLSELRYKQDKIE